MCSFIAVLVMTYPAMELYVSGFNAWGQLHLETAPNSKSEAEYADDIPTFTSVLKTDTLSNVRLRPFLSYTTVTWDGVERTAGYMPSEHKKLKNKDPQAYETLAEASNGIVAYIDSAGAVHQFATLHDMLSDVRGQTFPDLPFCTQIVAYETGFAALTSEGNIYTWGDERYGACLGRESSYSSPADKPGLVVTLQDLPTGSITKVAAGGYTLAALTKGHDVYVWGGHPGRKNIPAELSDEPTPVDCGSEDVTDIAVGESHTLIATTPGRVYAIGANSNRQLGSLEDLVESWTPVELNLPEWVRAVQLAAGPRNSLIVAKFSFA